MRPELTEEPIDQMAELKGDGLSNKNICRAVGIHEATLYRWLNKPSSKLHRALGEPLKKRRRITSAPLTTIREAALRKNSRWTAAAWPLERKYSDEYAQTARDRSERLVDEIPAADDHPIEAVRYAMMDDVLRG